ncbi:MAG: zinc-binding dehydrogenase [Planctomycetes bacterium]|nr:zinc-binding dehydrogenase [Planctomycetota bacterium]MCB9828578.1 zinc-binding dehydrogenase [Planctomycetota bacterium]MCB9900352.1 zinc-binding dehydrogenase [Planctomycetota bacterium]
MQAVVIREHGGLDCLLFEDRPVPEPGPGEVRVAVKAAGINHLDAWVRRGVPGHAFPLPIVPGCDGAGFVDALGAGVSGLEPGQRVVLAPGVTAGDDEWTARGEDQLSPTYGILGETRDGTCTDFVVLPARNAIPLADAIDFPTAAAFPLVSLTAWNMVVRRARLEPGETVLVHAAGSGVSTMAIQIARLAGAARVLATTSSEEKAQRARDLGADEVVDYTDPDWSRSVKRLTNGRGVDVVIDHVGAATFAGSLKTLVRGGRYVTCGATTGAKVEAHLNLIFFRNLSVLGSTMGSLGDLHRLLGLLEAERLAPVVDDVLPLAEVREAHRRLEAREVFGKLVLVPGDDS